MKTGVLAVCGALVCLLMLGGCATVPRDPVALAAYKATNDPLEPLNRKTFSFNQGVDRAILRPVAKTYVKVIPDRGRTAIRNFIKNLNEPLVFANNVLQGEFKRAGTTAKRFLINTTVGVAGFVDYASKHGLKRQIGDFGQTLYAWGVHEGPYLVVPIFGPTNPRDGIGAAVDIFIDPFFYAVRHDQYRSAISFTKLAINGIDERAQNIDVLDEVKRESVDFYAAFRSLYRQNRRADLAHGVPPPPAKEDDLYSDPGEEPQDKVQPASTSP